MQEEIKKYTHREVCEKLGVSASTVRNYIRSIIKKSPDTADLFDNGIDPDGLDMIIHEYELKNPHAAKYKRLEEEIQKLKEENQRLLNEKDKIYQNIVDFHEQVMTLTVSNLNKENQILSIETEKNNLQMEVEKLKKQSFFEFLKNKFSK